MSRGEKIVLVLTALLLCTGFAFLLLGERDAGHYSISALPEPTESAAQEPGGRINLNTASAEELAQLPGIGPSRALDIVRYREENGSFRETADVMQVRGIGESVYKEMRELVTVE
ncbi:MAG: ComEA family DNA-binding protein [Ruminococcaceae bacterium]|nr:ComEA family DNA-binding protein [Oscillospiraceae bacterium]